MLHKSKLQSLKIFTFVFVMLCVTSNLYAQDTTKVTHRFVKAFTNCDTSFIKNNLNTISEKEFLLLSLDTTINNCEDFKSSAIYRSILQEYLYKSSTRQNFKGLFLETTEFGLDALNARFDKKPIITILDDGVNVSTIELQIISNKNNSVLVQTNLLEFVTNEVIKSKLTINDEITKKLSNSQIVYNKSNNINSEIKIINNSNNNDSIYNSPEKIDKSAEFPGGLKQFERYITNAIKYPPYAQKYGIQGIVYVSFVVEKNGSISNVKIEKGSKRSLNVEAVRVVKNMPRWKPAEIDGKPVRTSYQLPIQFELKPKRTYHIIY